MWRPGTVSGLLEACAALRGGDELAAEEGVRVVADADLVTPAILSVAVGEPALRIAEFPGAVAVDGVLGVLVVRLGIGGM
jgi:hypothetical protein